MVVGYWLAEGLPNKEQEATAYTVETQSGKILRVIQAHDNKEIEIDSAVFIEYNYGMRVALVPDHSQTRAYSRVQDTQYID